MNFLTKTLGTLTGTAIPYTFGDVVAKSNSDDPSSNSLWTIYDGISDKDSMPVTIHAFDLKNPHNSKFIPNAKNAAKKHRALSLLPGVLTVVEVIENDRTIYLITEHATPISKTLARFTNDSKIWGIYQLSNALKFINIEGSCVHGNIRLNNVYITDSGEWKIGGFEFACNYKDDTMDYLTLYSNYNALVASKHMIIPPEFESNGVECFRQQLSGIKGCKFDAFLLGATIYQIYEMRQPILGDLSRSANFHGFPLNKLCAPSIGLRITSEQFLNNGAQTYFDNSDIDAYSRISQITLLDVAEKMEIFKALVFGNIPNQFLENKVIPQIVDTFNRLSDNQENIQTMLIYLLFKIYEKSEKESRSFELFFKPVYFKSFTFGDRAIRTMLLKILPQVVNRFTQYEVQNNIYPNLVTGFQDTDITVRTETLLSISYIMDKITERQLNNDLLRYLARLQSDSDARLRANTVICLNKISENMNSNTRIGVLVTAFGKALRDSDYVTRLCAVRGFRESIEYFSAEVCCSKVLSSLSPALLDKSSVIREEAEETFEMYMTKIRNESAKLETSDEDQHIRDDVKDLNNLLESLSLDAMGETLVGSISGLDTPRSTPFPESSMNKNNFSKSTLPSFENLVDDDLDFDDDGWGAMEDNEDEKLETTHKQEPARIELTKKEPARKEPIKKEPVRKPIKRSLTLGKTKPAPLKFNLTAQPSQNNNHDDDGWGDGW